MDNNARRMWLEKLFFLYSYLIILYIRDDSEIEIVTTTSSDSFSQLVKTVVYMYS